MPIYEYQCASCGARSDHLMRVSDPDPTECPNCDTPQLKRLLSAPQFRLAGGGWYETDFKGDKDKKRNLAGDTGTSTDTAAPKTETKTETKTDSGSGTASSAKKDTATAA